MKRKEFLGKCTLAALAIIVGALVISGCRKEDELFTRLQDKPQEPVVIVQTDTVYQIGSHTHTVSRTSEIGKVESYDSQTGETLTTEVPLGGIFWWINPHDTIEGQPVVYHQIFNPTAPYIVELDSLGCHLIRTTIEFTDRFNQYELFGKIWWFDGKIVIWGDTLEFPHANGGVNFLSVSTGEEGSDANWDYTLATSTYAVSSLWGVSSRYGYKTLKREKGSDELISVEKTDEGYEILTSNQYGPTSGKSWIELTYTYSQSGTTTQRVEQVLTCGATPDVDTTVYANSFNLSWRSLGMGGIQTTGMTTNGNVTIVSKQQVATVGAQNLYTRRDLFQWQTATWSDGTHTFGMPSPSYLSFNVNNSLTDLSPITGYNRMLATNTVTATFYGANVNVPTHTTVLVEAETPPVTPTIDHYELVDTGVTYVSPTVNNYWAKFRPVMTDGTLGSILTKDINCTNGMQCPAIGPEIAEQWADVHPVNLTEGPEQHQNGADFISGNWTVQTYTKKCTVNCALFNMIWTGSAQNPTLDFEGYHIVFHRSYSFAMSSGDYTSDMGQITPGNITYNRKLWTQQITATLNYHTNPYSGTCEVRVPDYIPRETPEWLGEPVDAKYTRVQAYTNGPIMDMIVFKYQNGVVMAPNGIVDMSLIYAFTAADALLHGVEQIGNPNAWYSGEYHTSKWHPAKITFSAGNEAWTYIADPQHQHTLARLDAIALGSGYDYYPIPETQNVTINGGVISISYPANNAGTTVTATCQLH